MTELSRRLAALEQASSNAPALRVVIAGIGETAQQAREREGISPDDKTLLVVIVFG
jgi:hypothetical protein